jgi:hypothetical protein
MVECPPQIDRERLVCLLVEAELLTVPPVPARVVVARGIVEAEFHVARPDPFAGVDHAPLEAAKTAAAGVRTAVPPP